MMKEVQYNLSPGVELKTAEYLTDQKLFHEYERLKEANFRSESMFEQLWRVPKFRRRVLEITRLCIFGVIVGVGIATISRLGLWYEIYHTIVTVF